MRKMLFIFNPRSGKAQIRNRLMYILDIFTKAGYEVSVHVTQRPKDAMEVAAARGNDADLIVCSGGDGTLNETISGMMLLDRIPDLGYIPAGSTNDFASSLKIPKNIWRWRGKRILSISEASAGTGISFISRPLAHLRKCPT